MSEIAKTYEPQSVEERWYAQWLADGCFTADPQSPKPAYSIVIPPPNVTGVLTLGHVLNNTIQDILARRARMLGKEVLWLPGTDHAGIATQTAVERALKKQGVIRHRDDLGRGKFLEKIWEWKEKHGGIIIQQLKKLGASCDWSRERFTMDPEYSKCVQRVFVDLYKKGFIYRGRRMVNWCPVSLTALSDEEVVMKPQNGVMYYFKVEVVAGVCDPGAQAASNHTGVSDPGHSTGTWLTIATTRPETIPGDTAVAVNPNDARYAHLIGKHIRRPLPIQIPDEEKLIPIIGDDHVEFEFGTGVLKVTPAHDKADFEIGQRHGLAAVDIMNPDGTMNGLAGESLVGLDRFEARNVAVDHLRQLEVLVKEEPYQNNVGYSERADVPIEPRLSEQWFLKYPSVEQAKACVALGSAGGPPAGFGGPPNPPGDMATSLNIRAGNTPPGVSDGPSETARGPRALPGKMRFFPDRWAKVYDHWMGGLQDWCVSRQLWWGHRVPVWKKRVTLTEENWTEELLRWGWDSYVSGNWAGAEGDDTSPQCIVRIFRTADGTEIDPRKDPLMPVTAETAGEHDIYYCTASEEEGSALIQYGFEQDPDVLDTWFSSWLWPFATMGWPEKTDTLAKFYPTTDLVTGPDIIFFWVARMIMAGYEWMGEMPFRNVYFTGIIRDKQGRKMSKSLGNSPDPLDLIAKFGADALRFGVMRSAPLGADILFDEKNVELGRNFCTKLWNAARFRQMHGGKDEGGRMKDETETSASEPSAFDLHPSSFPIEGEINPALLTSDDKWILLRLDAAIREVSTALDEYRFSDAAQTLHRFFWSEFCDWYLEASKASLGGAGGPPSGPGASPGPSGDVATTRDEHTQNTPLNVSGEPPETARGPRALPGEPGAMRKANTLAVTDFVLAHTLRLFHPFLPFITEELWHGLGYNEDLPADQGGRTIMFARWPAPFDDDFKAHYGLDESDERFANAKYEVVNHGRALRRDFNIASNKRVRFVFKPNAPFDAHEAEVLRILLNAETLDVPDRYDAPRGTPVAITPLGELFLPLEGLIDVDAERERLKKEIAKVGSELEKVRIKLADENFAAKVPAKVLDEHRQRETNWQSRLDQLQKMLSTLET